MREVTTVRIARRVARQMVRHKAGRKMGARTSVERLRALGKVLASLRSVEPSRPRAPKPRRLGPRVEQRLSGGSAARTVTGELRHVSRKHRLRDRRARRAALREVIGGRSGVTARVAPGPYSVGNVDTTYYVSGQAVNVPPRRGAE